ncbi:hypothetical protein [Ornithinimicrobium cerasi]|uniref:hypothetical protein n=1 Tax=Ornithinimicrobium cerasi TaxID=2248773 RepID=UPI00114194E5|nr:hypothetical protein [Ornithinimicrobium cerasi]
MQDVVATWRSAPFRARATAWVDEVLAARGERRTGPLTEVKVRFWAAVHAVPLRDGTAYLKAGNPGQAFEGELLLALGRLAPEHVVVPWAVLPSEGWWLLPDGGPPVERSEAGWLRLVGDAADLQRRCEGSRDRLGMLPALEAAGATDWLAGTVEGLTARPGTDARHLDPAVAAGARSALPRFRRAMERLDASGVPGTLQPNDVHPGNACAPQDPDRPCRAFDLGDAFWSHPWAVLHRALRGAAAVPLEAPLPDTTLTRRLVDAYAERWPEVARRDRLALVEAADRLGAAQRAASWVRLLDPVDPARLDLPTPPRVADFVAQALA